MASCRCASRRSTKTVKVTGSDGKRITIEWRLLITTAILIFWLVLFAPLFGVLNQPPLDEFLSQNGHAADCVFRGEGPHPSDYPAGTGSSKFDCKTAGGVLIATWIVAALHNKQQHSQVVLSRSESGPFAPLMPTLAPFLADAVFPIRAIMGIYTEIPSSWSILGGFLAAAGVLLFPWVDQKFRTQHLPLASLPVVQFFMEKSSMKELSSGASPSTAAPIEPDSRASRLTDQCRV